MINRVTLVGRLTRDAELRKTSNGTSVASFTVAVDNYAKAGEDRTASFIPVTIWDKGADLVAKFTHKGALIAVDGRLNQRSYTGKDGKNVSVLEVIADSVQFLEPKPETDTAPAPKNPADLSTSNPTQVPAAPKPADTKPANDETTPIVDDLPF